MTQVVDGLYKVDFGTPLGTGAGVVVLDRGKARGGDSGMFYAGEYILDGDQFVAKIKVDRHTINPGIRSVFGVDNADLELKGSIYGDTLTLVGTSPQAPGVQLSARMKRIIN